MFGKPVGDFSKLGMGKGLAMTDQTNIYRCPEYRLEQV